MSFTQIPDSLIDSKELTVYELACAIFIARKTMGWGKKTDGISLSQFVDSLSISKNTAIKAINGLANKQIIAKEMTVKSNGGQSFNIYSFKDEFIAKANESRHTPSSPDEQGAVHDMNRGGSPDEQGAVHDMNRQDKSNTKQTRQDKPISFSENAGQASKLEAPADADGESKKTKPRTDKAFLAECKQAPSFDLRGVPEPMVLEFIKYRRELKKPLQTSKGVQGIINALAELKSETSMRVAINYTMENEWMKIIVPAAPAPAEPTAAMMQAASAKGIVNGAVSVQMAAMVEYHTRKQNKVLDWDRAFSIWIERGAQFVAAKQPAKSRLGSLDDEDYLKDADWDRIFRGEG